MLYVDILGFEEHTLAMMRDAAIAKRYIDILREIKASDSAYWAQTEGMSQKLLK